jgi:hypothetical protein
LEQAFALLHVLKRDKANNYGGWPKHQSETTNEAGERQDSKHKRIDRWPMGTSNVLRKWSNLCPLQIGRSLAPLAAVAAGPRGVISPRGRQVLART